MVFKLYTAESQADTAHAAIDRVHGKAAGAVPASVRALLAHKWKFPQPPFSHFRSQFCEGATERDLRERRMRPSYDILHDADADARANGVCNIAEARALIADGVLDGLARDHGKQVTVNEHAVHALSDFCQTVQDAWELCQRRLQEAAMWGAHSYGEHE